MSFNTVLLATMEQTADLWFKECDLKTQIENLKAERKTLDLDSDRAFELKAAIKDTHNDLDKVLIQSDKTYNQLEKIDKFSAFYSEVNEIDAFLYGTIHNLPKGVYQFYFKQHPLENDFKNSIKNWLGKRAFKFYSLDEINDKLLLILILNFRNSVYNVVFDRVNKVLQLKIVIE